MSLLGAVLAFVRALPDRPASLLSRTITVAYLALKPGYRREIRRNVAIVLGQDRPWFWVLNGWRVGANLALMARIGQGGTHAIIDRAMLHYDNSVRMTLERELHMTAVSFHFGLWEFLPQVFARRGFDVRLVTGEQRDSAVQTRLSQMRQTGRVRLARSLRQAVRREVGPSISGFMLDNTSRGGQTWADAGTFRLRMPELPFRVAERQGDKLMPMFARFENGRLHVDVHAPADRDGVALALLEQVRQRPEEWVWWAKAGALESREGPAV